jgi:type II secretory pathway component GspD/PulD (secretin)
LDLARALVVELDKPRALGRLRAAVLEVRTAERSGSALEVLASLLGGRFSFSSSVGPQLPQSVGVALGGVSAVLSAVKGDSRVELLAEPMLAALPGTQATVNAGAQVPTIGSVSYGENGQPIRSIEYRDSGVSLQLLPVVRGDLVELSLRQERSSFAKTDTGVDETPTLNKSTASAVLRLKPGEAIAFAGLDEQSASRSKSGIFGGLLGARSRESSSGQLVLVVQAEVEPVLDGGAPEILMLDPSADGDKVEASGNG